MVGKLESFTEMITIIICGLKKIDFWKKIEAKMRKESKVEGDLGSLGDVMCSSNTLHSRGLPS